VVCRGARALRGGAALACRSVLWQAPRMQLLKRYAAAAHGVGASLAKLTRRRKLAVHVPDLNLRQLEYSRCVKDAHPSGRQAIEGRAFGAGTASR